MQEQVKEDQLKRTIDLKRSSGEFLNLALSSDGTASFSLVANDAAVVSATLSSATDLRLFGFCFFSFYLTSVSVDNLISGGVNTSGDYYITFWFDLDDSDGNNIVFKAFIFNNSGSDQTILVRENFRYIVEEAS